MGKASFVLAALLASQSSAAAPKTLTGSVTTSFGYTLAPEAHAASFSEEPDLFLNFSGGRQVELYAFIDRPTDPNLNFAVPKVIVTPRQTIAPDWALALNVSALDIDGWKQDGWRLRFMPAVEWTPHAAKGIDFLVRFGTYAQASEYRQYADGRDVSRYGLNEKFAVGLTWRSLYFEADLVFDQRFVGNTWKNDYSTYEKLLVKVSDELALGAAHGLLGTVVDESTGYARPYRVWDGHDSRFSALVEWDL